MNCPICNVTLQLAERRNVEIDYCPQCRGIWLDRGKLDKIIEQSVANSSSRPQQPTQTVGLADIFGSQHEGHHDSHKHHDGHHEDHGHHRKRGIFDLFD